MKYFYYTVLSHYAPENTSVLWIKPEKGKLKFLTYTNGTWTSIAEENVPEPVEPDKTYIECTGIENLYGQPTVEYLQSIGLTAKSINSILAKKVFTVTSGNYVFSVTYTEGTDSEGQYCFLLRSQRRDNAQDFTIKFWHNAGESNVYIDIYGTDSIMLLSRNSVVPLSLE